jgi:hypothetical protein
VAAAYIEAAEASATADADARRGSSFLAERLGERRPGPRRLRESREAVMRYRNHHQFKVKQLEEN